MVVDRAKDLTGDSLYVLTVSLYDFTLFVPS